MIPIKSSKITAAIFCVMLSGMTAATTFNPPIEFSETENRVLAQRPKAGLEDILSGKFESDYESYLADQFIFRNDWIGVKTHVERLLLKREIKGIYLAEDDYLIERHAGIFTTDRAQSNAATLARFVRRYQKDFNEGHLSVIIVPNAANILSDKLPPYAPSNGAEDYLNGIAASMPEGTWVDAARVLRAHADEELYYRTDHHWKTLAAFYVYRAWAKERGYSSPERADYKVEAVSHEFEGTIQSKLGVRTKGDTLELFYPVTEIPFTVQGVLYDYPALQTKDKYAVFLGGNHALLHIRTEAGNERKILVIKDSYANCFMPFMLGDFREIDILDLRYSRQRVSRLVAERGYTDLLILYNAAGFAEDTALDRLLF